MEFSLQNDLKNFNFFCSDPRCRESKKGGVRVTAVNHSKLPEEHAIHRSAHFRKLDDHAPNCEWVELEYAQQQEELAESEKNEGAADEVRKRRSHRKITRQITRFVIPDHEDKEYSSREAAEQLEKIRAITDTEVRRKMLLQYASGEGATATSLEALVSCYEELKEVGELDSEFTVRGHGRFKFQEVFRHFLRDGSDNFFIYHGGAHFYKSYGKGFSLNFIDKMQTIIDGQPRRMPVSFYVSSEMLKKYRPGMRFNRMIDEIAKNSEKKPYLRVYWIGGLEKGEKSYQATFSGLSHVVMRLVYPRQQSTSM
ncbi:hypothetical protein ACLBKS_03425 [Hylemonella sp. W303a]|uniref:hypothetical protein n=1 Tax=Hylemonella sp. W303a TaxID=3389873 RepID=UPI00396AFEF6